MKRKLVIIITSAIALCITIALVGSIGTGAWFTDQETSEGNTLTAGTLDLKVDGEDNPGLSKITIEDVKPGDTVYHYWVLKNTGSIDGQPSISFQNIVNFENDILEPESNAGDTTTEEGELGGFMYVMVKWRQPVGSGTWNTIKIVPFGNTFINYLAGPYGLGENGGSAIPVLSQDEEVEIEFRTWWHVRADDNMGQSDSVEFDVIFDLEQVH